MRCLAICHSELVIRTLAQVLPPSFDVDFLVESRPLARRLHDAGLAVVAGDLRRTETYLKADLAASTCVIVEDISRKSPLRILQALRDAGAALVYLMGMPTGKPGVPGNRHGEQLRARYPELGFLPLADLIGPPLVTEISRSMTRARVQQFQRYFNDADKVLILLHNDPDPDAMASGLALRNLLRRTKATAIIGAMQGVTRPENLRMAEPAGHPRRAGRAGRPGVVRPDRDGRRPASLLRGAARQSRSRHRPPPGPARLQRRVPGHPAGLRLDVHDPDRTPAGRRREHLRAHGHGDALRHQVGHAVLQPAGEHRRPRRLLVPLPAGRRRHDSQDGRRRAHLRPPRVRDEGAADRVDDRAGVLRVPRPDRPRGLHPVRGGLLPAGRRREVDDDLGRGRREPRRVGAQPGLHPERGRDGAEALRRYRQRGRPPGHGQGRHPAARVPREVRPLFG